MVSIEGNVEKKSAYHPKQILQFKKVDYTLRIIADEQQLLYITICKVKKNGRNKQHKKKLRFLHEKS